MMLADIELDVSRETVDRLNDFGELVKKWNPAINLISKSSVATIWRRHIEDSAQIYPLVPSAALNCVDVGSGGGFPAIVLSIISKELAPERHFTLIESDQRKSAFLREAARSFQLNVEIIPDRAEAIAPIGANLVTARALAPLTVLLSVAQRHLAPGGVCLFPKGGAHLEEIAEAKKEWFFECLPISSKTGDNGVILKIQDIRHV